MIRIAVVEDDPQSSTQLCQYIEDYGRESGNTVSVITYTDGAQFMDSYRGQFDIILLDIVLPLLDGMTTASLVRKSNPEVIIMFITSMAQYAIQGYQVDALDYILKPTNYFSFSQRLGRAVQRVKKREQQYIPILIRGGLVKTAVSDLLYVESQGHRILYHTRSGVHSTTGTIQKVEEDLSGKGFFRCNKGYLVNLEHVDAVQDGCAIVNGERLLISRARKADFMKALTDYIGGVRS